MNLVIGDTSQLAYYFPKDYIKISSRNINLHKFDGSSFDSVFLTFAEQRTYIQDDLKLFIETNVDYTLNIIKFFSRISRRVIVYGTCELWNNCEGPITINSEFDFNYTPYIYSKSKMCEEIYYLREKNQEYKNIIILHPFNFNSIYRKGEYLFGKIFDSLFNKRKIEIGNTYFYRDLIHPKYVVERSIKANKDELIGSGRLTHINDFIRDLYENMNMDYNYYVTENFDHSLKTKRRIFHKNTKICEYTYQQLLNDTLDDIRHTKNTFS